MTTEIKQPRDVKSLAPRTTQPSMRVDLDWEAYYRAFCQAHSYRDGGGVVDGGRVIFADGWSCSADSYGGPYVEPPSALDALMEVQVRYWRRRRGIVRSERDKLSHQLQGLHDAQRSHAMPLLTRRYDLVEAGDGRYVYHKSNDEVDWGALSMRLRWLMEDADLCDSELLNLGETP